ncbi:four-helix bundle copper-binding protein [Arthrobacter sp. MSA 4-2]|uniref:four-helix bundle copper-binding protein n=1 Tax=Arthrobacter sp. MSA 4-2 TaxID=2794349 RepID=UPI0018E7CF6F|nr:four-helix bundle copper-binding protein [Arthrobacter sp. MSA 4-2]
MAWTAPPHREAASTLPEWVPKPTSTTSYCADICAATGKVLSRHTAYDATLTHPVLAACEAACRACAEECETHASTHEHCRICAGACRRCENACRELAAALG